MNFELSFVSKWSKGTSLGMDQILLEGECLEDDLSSSKTSSWPLTGFPTFNTVESIINDMLYKWLYRLSILDVKPAPSEEEIPPQIS